MWRLCLFAFFLLPTGQILGQKVSSSQPYSDPEASSVYRALTTTTVSGKAFLILATTRKPMCQSFTDHEAHGGEFKEAMANFDRLNNQMWSLEELLHDNGTQLVSQHELDSFFKTGAGKGWKRFYAVHPKAAGYKAFSAVGFNQQHTIAVVYSESICGSQCGVGGMHFMKLTSQGWQEVAEPFATCKWIS